MTNAEIYRLTRFEVPRVRPDTSSRIQRAACPHCAKNHILLPGDRVIKCQCGMLFGVKR